MHLFSILVSGSRYEVCEGVVGCVRCDVDGQLRGVE